MFLLVSFWRFGAHPGGHQHGVSLQISINLGKTFLRKSRIRNILLTWILARNLLYLPPFISQIPDFIYWTVLIFILIYFEWRDIENQQLGKTRKWKVREKLTEREKAPPLLSFLLFIFVFALSQFSGPDYLGTWNKLSKARTLRPYPTKNNSKLAWCTIKALPTFRVTKRQTSK